MSPAACHKRATAPKKEKKKLLKFPKTFTKPRPDDWALQGMVEGEPAKRKKRENKDFVYPIRTPIKHKDFLVLDIESKKGDTQEKGFERPFQSCTYDGVEYKSFFNASKHKKR